MSPNRAHPPSCATRYRYVGKDAESGLYYYGVRYYSAWSCRFISIDPLATRYAQLTPYNYAGNNVIGDFDIDGMQCNETAPCGSAQETPTDFASGLVQVPDANANLGSKAPELLSNLPLATSVVSNSDSVSNEQLIQVAAADNTQRTGAITSPTDIIENDSLSDKLESQLGDFEPVPVLTEATIKEADRTELHRLLSIDRKKEVARNKMMKDVTARDPLAGGTSTGFIAAYTALDHAIRNPGDVAMIVVPELAFARAARFVEGYFLWKSATAGRQSGATFLALDGLGRPTGINATITRDMLGTGTRALQGIRPPGFGGEAAGHTRGHLLGAQLGGSGTEIRNLVTLMQNPVNSPVMRGFENSVAAAVRSGETIAYSVVPVYDAVHLAPKAITISAQGFGFFP